MAASLPAEVTRSYLCQVEKRCRSDHDEQAKQNGIKGLSSGEGMGTPMAERFASKIVLIAGGTGGLGRAVSLAFLDELAHVSVTYRREDEFVALKNASGAHGSSLEGFKVDVTDEAAVRQLTAKLLADHGRLDVLVNAIGGYAGGTPLWELEPKVFEQMLALNLRSMFVLSRVVVPVMLKQGNGAILNVASKAAFDHAAGAAAYVASKAAAVAMMDSLAADLRGTNVRANSIVPSIIDTEANRKAMPGADFAKWPKPEEIARVILFLCSEDAKLVHGAAVPVYGNA
jgi:NAD(P)-dependent dehydrogenase (short-subunit alcohol dehydrogenase family)